MNDVSYVPGEPHQWCPDRAQLVEDLAMQGASTRTIARKAGITRTTLMKYYRDAYEAGMGDNETVLLGTLQRNAKQQTNLNASNTASAFLLERRHGYKEQVGIDLNINDEAETEAAIQHLEAKLETMFNTPMDLDQQLIALQDKITVGDFTGDLEAFKAAVLALCAPTAQEVEPEGTGTRATVQ